VCRPIRDSNPEIYRLITIRTVESRLWMIPTRKLRKLLGGILGRYQEILGIEIYAYCFLSNHFHLVIKSPRGNTDEFLENVNREIARRVNWMHRRSAKFWQRRYDDQQIVTEADLLEAFLYVTTNATHHGLVDHPGGWPGLSSYVQSIHESNESYTFHCYSIPNQAKRASIHTLKLSPLPHLAALKKEERCAEIKRLIEQRTTELVEKRFAAGGGFLGAEAVLKQIPGSLPQESSRSRRPHCYSKNSQARREFRLYVIQRRTRYRECSMRFRLGDWTIEFPPHSFRPPLHRKPRLRPFTLLPEDHFKKAA
jgi:REP element-mobilizing transposase RayT